MSTWEIRQGAALERLRETPDRSVQMCVTSPPYFGLRDYGDPGQIGLESTPDEYVSRLVEVFREVRRVLRDDGTLWLNLGDSYNGNPASGGDREARPGDKNPGDHQRTPDNGRRPWQGAKPKDLLGIPWMVAFALRQGGWYLRSDIIWAKPNPMPESVTDRPTKAHEYLFLLSKSKTYYYDVDAIREPHDRIEKWGFEADGLLPSERSGHAVDQPRQVAMRESGEIQGGPGFRHALNPAGRNKRSVWTVATQPFPGAHFAVFPPKLIEPCVLAGSSESDTVLDPFAGAGTTGLVATRHGRSFIGIELNPEYAEMARQRIRDDAPLMNYVSEAA